MLSEEVERAVKDLRYLLDRGYPRSSAVEFVSNHYELVLEDRHLLARCVFSKGTARDHKSRLVEISELEGDVLGVDGYNVLITVEGILERESVVKCDDGFVRDLKAVFGKYKMSDSTEEALREILRTLKKANLEKVVFLFDKQVSRSGELSGLVREMLDEMGVSGEARTTSGTDAQVWKHGVSASSDRVIIERSEKMLDLPGEILEDGDGNLIDLTQV